MAQSPFLKLKRPIKEPGFTTIVEIKLTFLEGVKMMPKIAYINCFKNKKALAQVCDL